MNKTIHSIATELSVVWSLIANHTALHPKCSVDINSHFSSEMVCWFQEWRNMVGNVSFSRYSYPISKTDNVRTSSGIFCLFIEISSIRSGQLFIRHSIVYTKFNFRTRIRPVDRLTWTAPQIFQILPGSCKKKSVRILNFLNIKYNLHPKSNLVVNFCGKN